MRKSVMLLAVVGLVGWWMLSPTVADEKTKAAPPDTKKKAEPETAKAKPEIEVPYVPTPNKVVEAMLKLAQVKEGDVVYDLGCGDGRIVIRAVTDFKAKQGLGIDFDPDRLKDCEKNLEKIPQDNRKKLTFKQGDVLKLTEEDFKGVDVVTLYLLPEVNIRLKPILQKGLKPGARIVSHDFDMGEDWKPEQELSVGDDDGFNHMVYLWTIPAKK